MTLATNHYSQIKVVRNNNTNCSCGQCPSNMRAAN